MNIISKNLHEILEKWRVKFDKEQNHIMNLDIDPDDKKMRSDRIRETIKQNNTAIKNNYIYLTGPHLVGAPCTAPP
jgi:hypothetical protein